MTLYEWKPDPERCQEILSNSWGRPRQCSRKGVVEEDGKIWCKQHAPTAVKKRREETAARWEAQDRAREKEDMDRAWRMVVNKIRKMNPKLADEVAAMAEKSNEQENV